MLQHLTESYDGVTTSIHLFKMHEEEDEEGEDDYYANKVEVLNRVSKNEVNIDAGNSNNVDNTDADVVLKDEKEDNETKIKKPICINFGISVKNEDKENETINKILDNTSLLVTNSFNPAQLYIKIFNTKQNKNKLQKESIGSHSDNTPSHHIPPLSFNKPHQLQDSNEYDCVQCALVADVDMDGCKEIILGTYGQVRRF